jgi:hypothetical protein
VFDGIGVGPSAGEDIASSISMLPRAEKQQAGSDDAPQHRSPASVALARLAEKPE